MHKPMYSRFLLGLVTMMVVGIAGIQAQQLDLSRLKAMKARAVGPAGMSGRVTAIDVVRNRPEIIYVGSASGGLWKSESGGIRWEPLFDSQRVASIGAIAIFQKNPSIIWVGTGEGNPRNSQTSGRGVYRSLDAGKTWQFMGLEKSYNIHRIIVHPDNPDIVYVGVHGSSWGDHPDRGVFRTTDGGKTWSKVLFTNERSGVADMVMDPSNPNKIFAAMWEFHRDPWFFKSGGKGSGLYVTIDGGNTWEQRTNRDSLPAGDLGRIGLAIARNNPNVVYANVEAKKNALYRSNDGGKTWRKVNDTQVGERPFYYNEIYVDPSNENRLYELTSLIKMSEDGGRTWRVILPYSGVHPDHHAWYIHPDNPSYLIEGNDGGLNISHDMGRSWRFIDNLPLGQFYHVRVDNEVPYNLYGGMQDNGSWVGPNTVWRTAGIRNSYWQELLFGDGFDVLPDRANSRYGWAMSQGGNVSRYDRATGYTKPVKPAHPNGTKLRFNWNAAIAEDPFEPGTIYFGSQFLHKSTNRGDSWEIISPDLTTNDSTKQKQGESGGLTYDATGAENYCTIIAIAPSPKDRNVIWVGTDDGNVQLTRDGGKTWTNMASRLPGVPKGAWVPVIVASSHNPGEAFVVVNNYRQNNDWRPFLYHTRDYGQTWTNLVDEKKVDGYMLSVVQDPIEPKLLFAGSEFALYVSIDYGKTWTRWTNGYPTVSTYDLAIHPRDHDLVVATFGRAFYVLDDIRPLRALAQQGTAVLDRTVSLFPIPDAYRAEIQQSEGLRFEADGVFNGQNRPFGAMISFSVKEGKKDAGAGMGAGRPGAAGAAGAGAQTAAAKPGDKPAAKPAGKPGAPAAADTTKPKAPAIPVANNDTLKMEILDGTNAVIRTLKFVPETGLNRVQWNLDRAGVRGFGGGGFGRGNAEPGGNTVLPGRYKVRVSYRDGRDSQYVEVKMDPRTNFSVEKLKETDDMLRRIEAMVPAGASAIERITEMRAAINATNGQLPTGSKEEQAHKDAKKRGTELLDSLKTLRELFLSREGGQGIQRSEEHVSAKFQAAYYTIASSNEGVDATHQILFRDFEARLKAAVARVNFFMANSWAQYKAQIDALKLSPFKPTDPIEIKN